VLSAEWIQHLSLLLYSHVHDASRPEQSAGMVYFWMIAKSCVFLPPTKFAILCISLIEIMWSRCVSFLVGWSVNHAFFRLTLVPVLFRSAEFWLIVGKWWNNQQSSLINTPIVTVTEFRTLVAVNATLLHCDMQNATNS
jgi:hypothetical protein